MDLWERARVFAEEAAKRSQEISKEAAKRSQELTQGAAKFSQEFVSETAKKSKELAAEATKKADLIRSEALRAADQIKTLAVDLPTLPISPLAPGGSAAPDPALDLERFGITDELRDFVKGISLDTFRDFPMQGLLKENQHLNAMLLTFLKLYKMCESFFRYRAFFFLLEILGHRDAE